MTIRPERAALARGVGALLLALGATLTSVPARAVVHPKPIDRATAARTIASLPIRFEENRGQADESAKFVARCGAFDALFTPAAVRLVPVDHREAAVALRFGAAAEPVAEQRMRMAKNYMRGRDPKAWLTDVPAFARVRYPAVAPSVDVVFYGNGGRLEYDLVLAPGADPEALTIAIDGASGLEIDSSGALVAHTAAGDLRQDAPRIYQQTAAGRREVSGRYVLTAPNRASIRLGEFDRGVALVIDPQVGYSALFGGSAYDGPNGTVVDSSGALYILGFTQATSFPGVGAVDGPLGGDQDVFVAKLAADGASLEFVTVIGGSMVDSAAGFALDAQGNIYVVGTTASDDFPVTPGAFQSTRAGALDAYVLKLAPAGDALVYSTFLGGTSTDFGGGIAVDAAGEAVVTGRVDSPDFPIANAFQPTMHSDASSGFVTKLDSSGSGLVYSTYLGGSSAGNSGDAGTRVAMDAGGNTIVTGVARSTDFPVLNAMQPTSGGGFEGFIAKVSASGQLVFSTYLGASGNDFIDDLAVDAAGDIYVAGGTSSPDFPVVNAFQKGIAGGNDAFVAKVRSDGSGLIYSSYLGGSYSDTVYALAVDRDGDLVVGGTTASSDFPNVDASQTAIDGTFDGFVAKVDPTGAALVYSTFLGGSDTDYVADIAVDGAGNVYATGETRSGDFPTTAGALRVRGDLFDVFVTKFLAPAGFSLAMTPSTLTIERRHKGTVDVEITRTGGFAGEVEVTAPDTSALKIKVKPPSGSTTGDRVSFAFKVKRTAPTGPVTLVFTGRDADGTTHTATLTLVVQ